MRVGLELVQESDFSAAPAQDEFAADLQPPSTSPQLWAARQKMLSFEDVRLCLCKHGELWLLGAVSTPDVCARLARIASRVNSSLGSDVYRINALVKTVTAWQPAAILKYLSSSHMSKHARGDADGKMRRRGEQIRGETATLVEWAHSACGEQSTMGKRRRGCVSGLTSSTLRGPAILSSGRQSIPASWDGGAAWEGKCTRSVRWRSTCPCFVNFTHTLLTFSRARWVLRIARTLFTHSKNKKIIAEKFRVPHIWSFSGPWRRRNRATLTGCQD